MGERKRAKKSASEQARKAAPKQHEQASAEDEQEDPRIAHSGGAGEGDSSANKHSHY